MTSTVPDLGRYQFGWADPDVAGATARRGLSRAVVEEISALKNEPEWMLKMRLKGLSLFEKKPMPTWGADLSGIDFDNIKYFVRSTEKQAATWDDLPADIRNTYDKLGIPEAEKQRLIAGVAAQYECLAGDVPVWTANRGCIPIKEVEAGDQVFAYDESTDRLRVFPVRAAAQTGEKQTFVVKVGARQLRATANHPFLTLVDEPGEARQPRWRTLSELSAGDLVAVPRELPAFGEPHRLPAAEGLRTPAESTADLMWLLGLFVGAGHPQDSDRTDRVQFAIPATEPELRAELARVVDQLFGLRVIPTDQFRVRVDSKALVTWLWAIGLAGTLHVEHLPDWLFGLPVDQRLAFLGGWVDAAGDIAADGGSVVLTGVNPPLIDQALELARLLGLPATGSTGSSRTEAVRGGEPVRVCIGDQERLGCRQVDTGRHPDQTTNRAPLGFARITEIEPYGVEPVYDIEVDGPHNFVADGVLVHNSEVVYHKIREDLEQQGVLFLDTDTGLREHEDIFREYFGTVIPPGDNKFAALNTAVWSGGSFIYVPPGVNVEIPLQAYFRINTENMGQFERTLIIVDEGAYVHYVEGCTAPIYSSDSLHSAVVEIIVKPHGRARYTTIQNWSNNVYNLVTKRAAAHEGATMEWIDGNIGSKVTMKYPSIYLLGEHAKGETLSIAFAGEGQHQDAGAKMIHCAPNTSSTIVSKSVARGGGRTSYRGLVQIEEGARESRSTVRCDALLVDTISRSDTYPYVDVREDDVSMGHEATVSKVSEDQLFYLMSRGLTEEEAMAMIVRGFIEPIARELPMEYALELNRLIELQMEGAVG
jgi:FeS assembly protein SufB